MTLTEELITAAVTATDDRKAAALKALRGEIAAQPGKIIQGPLLLGVGAAAKFLGVSRGTFWRAMQAGKIRKIELHSGSFRVRKEDLLELAAGSVGGEQLAVDSKATLTPALSPPRAREKNGKSVAV